MISKLHPIKNAQKKTYCYCYGIRVVNGECVYEVLRA